MSLSQYSNVPVDSSFSERFKIHNNLNNNNHVQHHTTPLNHFQPVIETQNTDQDSDDIVTRSREDEKRVFAVISYANKIC